MDLDKVMRKARPLIYMFGKLRYYITDDIAIQIYKTYVLAVLESGLYTLDGFHSTQVSRLQKLQNKALRYCVKGIGIHLFLSIVKHAYYPWISEGNIIS